MNLLIFYFTITILPFYSLHRPQIGLQGWIAAPHTTSSGTHHPHTQSSLGCPNDLLDAYHEEKLRNLT